MMRMSPGNRFFFLPLLCEGGGGIKQQVSMKKYIPQTKGSGGQIKLLHSNQLLCSESLDLVNKGKTRLPHSTLT